MHFTPPFFTKKMWNRFNPPLWKFFGTLSSTYNLSSLHIHIVFMLVRIRCVRCEGECRIVICVIPEYIHASPAPASCPSISPANVYAAIDHHRNPQQHSH